MFPKEIEKFVKGLNYTIDIVGRSDDSVYIFEDKYILKISSDETRLEDEKKRVDFLNECNFPGSKSICYVCENGLYYYLRTCINGVSLIDKRFTQNPELLIDVLVDVIEVLRKLDDCNCPFKSKDNEGNDFVHGDLCLPNIYVDDNNKFIGFIDLDNAGLGDKWYDYAWLLWSFQHNLKTDSYNDLLLKKLNIKFDKDKYEKYIPEDYRNR